MARAWFGIWKLINESVWVDEESLSATPGDPSMSQPTLELFQSTAARDQDRARWPYIRECRTEPNQEFVAGADEPLLPEPSDDGASPAKPVGDSTALPAHFHLLGNQDPRLTVQGDINSLQAPASERPGGPIVASSNKEKRAPKGPEKTDLDVKSADFGFPLGNDKHIRLDATGADRDWPNYERLFNFARVARLAGQTLNTTPSRDSDPGAACARQWEVDPVSKALYDCGAERADSSEFCMLSSGGAQIYPPASSGFLVYKMPARRIRAQKNIHR